MRLFATMCNQPQRLLEALAPARAALVAAPPVARWGLGYVQSGEVLLARTPRPSATPVDLYAALEGVKGDCVLGHAVPDGHTAEVAPGRDGGTDETPPFRYRRWMFVQDAPVSAELAHEPLAGQVPEFLRRNLKGHGAAELTFHLLLALLHDVGGPIGGLDNPNLPMATLRSSVAAALARVSAELAAAGVVQPIGNLAVSNGRAMLVARPADGPPLWLRRLHVAGERGGRDETFRGVLFVSACVADGPAERELGVDGFEEIPGGSVVMVSRDLRVDVSPL